MANLCQIEIELECPLFSLERYLIDFDHLYSHYYG